MQLSLKATTPDRIDFDQTSLTIVWKDGATSVFELVDLRRRCPCVVCKGGHGGKVGTTTGGIQSIQLYGINKVGRYAIHPVWSDNHQTGIYSFDSLRMLADGLGGDLMTT
ncbi:DUF971 domain-containing protein [Leptospira ellisii]|uniref:DUF971 domain-containing protein n=1 Tax=Leptospira ellisii TaxID=2023197 RepID=A0A2N0BH16_9LEPT|nr:DUF971 domain-containing protein [Leptospira ellisii]MDV6235200.1 DUF971 domain-containing protein [Leptospira ellisii]PJZ94824.1 hypothetical protein CH379_00605 [Leptospira ellisii]PKA03291.1 hypothetical protein CH375_17870 [Leptospira ellisii]